MKIFVTGTRGMPDIPGGIEKHCQGIYPRVADMGHEVYVAVRKPYVRYKEPKWHGVNLVPVYAPRKSSLETIVHTCLAIFRAKGFAPDILHVHGVGPGLLVPLGRALGMKVVVTHHGPDYERQKWGWVARVVLRLGEWVSVRWADAVIVLSPYLRDMIKNRYGRDTYVIPNGVRLPEDMGRTEILDRVGVAPGKYILAVSRIEPGKGLRLLLEAFLKVKTDLRLVIAGYITYESACSRQLKQMAKKDGRVVFAGHVEGDDLSGLYANAAFFVLPSYHEGLPISLLEAMSYGLPVLVSDIAANREVGLDERRYFTCGDVGDLAEKLSVLIDQGVSEEEKAWFRKEIAEKYDWGRIAGETVRVYEKVLSFKF